MYAVYQGLTSSCTLKMATKEKLSAMANKLHGFAHQVLATKMRLRVEDQSSQIFRCVHLM